jgi:hypothetical protein
MLSKCMNPSCSKPFRYLSTGRLFTLEMPVPPHAAGSGRHLERFWLCTQCSAELIVVLRNGQATVEPRFLKRYLGERVERPDQHQPLLA